MCIAPSSFILFGSEKAQKKAKRGWQREISTHFSFRKLRARSTQGRWLETVLIKENQGMMQRVSQHSFLQGSFKTFDKFDVADWIGFNIIKCVIRLRRKAKIIASLIVYLKLPQRKECCESLRIVDYKLIYFLVPLSLI